MDQQLKDQQNKASFPNVLSNIGNTQFVLITALLGAWTWQMLPGNISEVMETNRWAQWMVLYIVCVTTLSYFTEDSPWYEILLKGLLALVIYIIVSKQYVHTFVPALVLFGVIAFLQNSHTKHVKEASTFNADLKVAQQVVDANKDLNDTEASKISKDATKKANDLKKLVKDKVQTAQKLSVANTIISVITLVLVVVGVSKYTFDKYVKYGKDENKLMFFLKFLFEKGTKGPQSAEPILKRFSRSKSAPEMSRDATSWDLLNVPDRAQSDPLYYYTNPINQTQARA